MAKKVYKILWCLCPSILEDELYSGAWRAKQEAMEKEANELGYFFPLQSKEVALKLAQMIGFASDCDAFDLVAYVYYETDSPFTMDCESEYKGTLDRDTLEEVYVMAKRDKYKMSMSMALPPPLTEC